MRHRKTDQECYPEKKDSDFTQIHVLNLGRGIHNLLMAEVSQEALDRLAGYGRAVQPLGPVKEQPRAW